MFEPHLGHPHHGPESGGRAGSNGDGGSLLDELDKIAPIKAFDAFPKVRLLRMASKRDRKGLC